MSGCQALHFTVIADIVSALTRFPRDHIRPDTLLAETGMDSLMRVALIEELEKLAGQEFSGSVIEKLITAEKAGELLLEGTETA